MSFKFQVSGYFVHINSQYQEALGTWPVHHMPVRESDVSGVT